MWFLHHRRHKVIERARQARLAKAEEDLAVLRARASRAIVTLDERREENHWRESIEHMIKGGL